MLHGDMISEYVNLYGEWCESEVFLYSTILTSNSNVVEIGGNIGMHTIPLAQICNKGKVFCYEPQRIIYQILNANIALNNLLNVYAQRLAIGCEDSAIGIQSSNYDLPWNYGSFSISSGFSSEGYFNGHIETEMVPVKPLDTIEEATSLSSLDLLKIDVEGAEESVLKGASQLITRLKPAIFIENNNEKTGNKIINLIQSLVYRFPLEKTKTIPIYGVMLKPRRSTKCV